MKFLKSLTLLLALGATALTAFSQGVPASGQFAVNTLTLPYSTLTAGVTTGASTNLAAGWSAIVSVTNTYTTWNSSSNAFITTTNVVSSTNTAYADIPIVQQKDTSIFLSWNVSGACTSNRVLTLAPFLDSGTVATNSSFTWSVASAGTSVQTYGTNIPATFGASYAGYRVIKDQCDCTNSLVMTNSYLKYPIKRNVY